MNGYLIGYCGRSLTELPVGVELWLRWAYARRRTAQSAADFLANVRWPGRVTLDADPLVLMNRRRVLSELSERFAA